MTVNILKTIIIKFSPKINIVHFNYCVDILIV
jgi:hypothetical protein